MNVVHVITGLENGGAEGVLFRLVTHDVKNKHVVISLRGEGKYGPLLQSAGIDVHCLHWNNIFSLLFGFFSLIKIIKSYEADVVQTWMYHADLLGGCAAYLSGVKKIFWGIRHSDLSHNDSKRITRIIAKVCAIMSNVIPTKIICCANKASEVHVNIGYKKNKIIVIPNGYDMSNMVVSTPSVQNVKNEMNIGNDFVIGMVGRYHPQKDHANLLESLSYIKEKGCSFVCVLVGNGMDINNSALKSKIEDLQLEDYIRLLGPRPDIPVIMNALDLHVLSSKSGEGFPNVVAEAMACGTQCVVTDVGDAKKIVGDLGWCVNSEDSRALGDAILDAYQEWGGDRLNWNARSNRLEAEIEKKYSINLMVERYKEEWLAS